MSFETKFKERTPQETINIIKSFFANKNYTIIEEMNLAKNVDLWSAHLILFYEDKSILTSNGKGLSKEFCLASAYGELYERYCNRIFAIANPFVINDLMKESYQKYGYYLSKDEKTLSYNEAIEPLLDFVNIVEDCPGQAEYLFKTITNNQFIGIPYASIHDEKKQLFLDPRILLRAWSSTGMAAGNSFQEAFNQGMSEVFEHHATGLFFERKIKQFYQLNLNNIQNKTLLNIIKKIQQAGNDLYIYDLSYNLNIPVLCAVLVNHHNHGVSVNFGSFPYFDIALERILTEMYQGVKDFDFIKLEGQKPYRNRYSDDTEAPYAGSATLKDSIPEEIFLNYQMVEYPNEEIFLFGENKNNDIIYNYYKELSQKNNIEVYYRDYSQCSEVCAIQIFTPYYSALADYRIVFKNISNKNNVFYFCVEYYKLLENIFKGNYNFEDVIKLTQRLMKFNSFESWAVLYLFGRSWEYLGIEQGHSCLYLSEFILYNKLDNMDDYLRDTIDSFLFYPPLNKFIILYKYINSKKYSKEEIFNIFRYLKINLTELDFQNYNNKEYLIKEIFYNPLHSFYNSITYSSFLDSLGQ